MTANNRLSHSIFWAGAFTAVLLTGCKKSDTEKKSTREATVPKTETATEKTAEKSATTAPAPEVAVVEQVERIERPMDAKQADAVVQEGREVAAAIDAAIRAIDAGKATDAKAEVSKALDALAKLEHDRPNVEIITTLWRGNQELTFVEKDALDTIPLLERMTRVEIPVYDRKAIETRLEQRKGQAAGSATSKDKSTDLEIVDANLVYEEVDLPIASTSIHVHEAKKLLDENKLAEAKDALMRAVGSVGVIEVIVEAPEYRAQKLVWGAQTAFVNDDMAEAKRLLAEAHALLAPLAKHDADAQGQSMVTMLLAEMKPLQDALDTGTKPAKDAFRRVEHNAQSLVRRTVLRGVLAARHENERLTLADTLMWLEKSKTDGLSTAETPETRAAATHDLTLAEAALSRAAKEAPASAKPQLDDLHARVAHLITLDADKSRKPAEIEAELRGITFELRMLMLNLGLPPSPSKKPSGQG